MIHIASGPRSGYAAALVCAAVGRSAGRPQASLIRVAEVAARETPIVVLAACGAEADDEVAAWRRHGPRKLVVFGALPPPLMHEFGFASMPGHVDLAAARSPAATPHRPGASRAIVGYGARAALLGGRSWRRPFERFDFADEWNNLGYGAIRSDGSMWSVGPSVQAPEGGQLAAIEGADVDAGSYAALVDTAGFSLLWFNRDVGPIDSFEWRLVESFISNHRAEDLPCAPVLREIPWSHDAAVTMRLDCDEDVSSALPLMDRYRDLGVPLSLAVTTRLLDAPANAEAVRKAVSNGGSILSHSATHAPEWGGGLEAALAEAQASAAALASVTGSPPRFAVSPFHQTPAYALEALHQAGYLGCVGGIIGTSPEFLLARGGRIAGIDGDFVGHSQQCMLHGDCLLAEGDPLATYKAAFDLACETGTLFGYLDHPFSARYQYGWASEAQRLDAHAELIAHIRRRAKNPLFLNEDDALDWLRLKAAAEVTVDGETVRIETDRPDTGAGLVSLEYRGRVTPVRSARIAA